MKNINRRRVLRGMLNGGAVTVGLPLLNCFLNGNGSALASGEPLPVRFGTWMWGLGMNRAAWVPKKVGANYDLPQEIASFAPVRDYINVFSGFDAFNDSSPALSHYTGWIIMRSGIAPASQTDKPGETIDVTVANQIGRTTRFKSLTATANGDVRATVSYENANTINAPEVSPVEFYTRLFGPDFQDPNALVFTPSPRVMVRKSALSATLEDTKALKSVLGAEDQARLDEYFTGLRHLERQLDQQLVKPEPIDACRQMPEPTNPKVGIDIELLAARHRLMTDLMVMGVACDQTRVFNMAYTDAQAATTKAGYEKPHHACTHEEPIDAALGYQPITSWFTGRSMESFTYFVQAFSKIKEGDSTLLDNCLIFASSDHSYARIHAYDNMPMMTAGRAGGKVKTGVHVAGGGGPCARLGYTALKVMGVDVTTWGAKTNQTSKEIGDILV